MKSTEKSRANRRQKSRANSRQKSIANNRQGEPKDCDREEAKYGENTAQRKAAASQSQMFSRSNTSQEERYELKLGEVITTIPTVDVTVAKQRREDTTGRHDEVQRNPDGQKLRSAQLRIRSKKQNVFDSESRSDASFTGVSPCRRTHR